jgi:hypothetical protein
MINPPLTATREEIRSGWRRIKERKLDPISPYFIASTESSTPNTFDEDATLSVVEASGDHQQLHHQIDPASAFVPN